MFIVGVQNSVHDASACLFEDYKLVAAASLERLTRRKNDGVNVDADLPFAAIDYCLGIAGISRADVDVFCLSRGHLEVQSYKLSGRWRIKQALYRLIGKKQLMTLFDMNRRQQSKTPVELLDLDRFRHRYGFSKAQFHVYSHHEAHGAAAYFYSNFREALIYTADGIGDNISYSAGVGRADGIEMLEDGEALRFTRYRVNSIGLLYTAFTGALGFIMNRHEGKLTGLAGFGQPVAAAEILAHFTVNERGEISSDFPSYPAMDEYARAMCARLSRQDAAASIQEALEQLICKAITIYQARTGQRSLVLSGGVFANVRLNRVALERTEADSVFVFPAMGDEGLPVGGCLLYLLQRDGMAGWQAQRTPLRSLYLGRSYDDGFDAVAVGFAGISSVAEGHIERAVDELIAGRVVAIFTGRMEYGPRALGARSILAAPVRSDINDTINKRLERSEFMPFAPAVLDEHAAEVFEINPGNAHAARFMTITCGVKPQWRDRIPAVVHVDGSARPQTIRAEDNPLYHAVLSLYHRRTSLPVLVNTSFNVHEEPIVDTPAQALKSLAEGRVDFILTEGKLYSAPARLDQNPRGP